MRWISELLSGIEMSFELNCSIASDYGRAGLSGRTLINTTSASCSRGLTTRNPSASFPVFM
jgi:hypothetical protein